MGLIFLYLCSGLCAVVYVTSFVIGVQQMVTRRAIFSVRLKQLRFTGAAGILFGLGQALGATVSIIGISVAVQERNLLLILPFMLVGALIGMAGMRVARVVQVGEYEFDITPKLSLNLQQNVQVELTSSGFRMVRTDSNTGASHPHPADVIFMESAEAARPVDAARSVDAARPVDEDKSASEPPMIVSSTAEIVRDDDSFTDEESDDDDQSPTA